jgi:hypothetical protein
MEEAPLPVFIYSTTPTLTQPEQTPVFSKIFLTLYIGEPFFIKKVAFSYP